MNDWLTSPVFKWWSVNWTRFSTVFKLHSNTRLIWWSHNFQPFEYRNSPVFISPLLSFKLKCVNLCRIAMPCERMSECTNANQTKKRQNPGRRVVSEPRRSRIRKNSFWMLTFRWLWLVICIFASSCCFISQSELPDCLIQNSNEDTVIRLRLSFYFGYF